MQVRKQVRTRHEQWIGSKSGKEYVKALYFHPAYSTYMQSTSCETLGWMKHKLESRLLGRNLSNLRYADDTTFMAEFPIEIPVGFVSITGSCLSNSHCPSLWLKKLSMWKDAL